MNADASDRTSPRKTRRWSWRAKLGIAIVLALIVNGVVFLREAQQRDDQTLARLKMLERRANPLMLKLAAVSPLGLSSLEHRGRVSGTRYLTPLAAARVPGGFLFAMPYGEQSDWAKNLIAAGEGIVTFDGDRYLISNPRVIVASDALSRLPWGFRIFSQLLGIQRFMDVDATQPVDRA